METGKNDRRSVLMYVSSLLIVGTIGAFRRWLPLSSGLLVFARGVLGALSLALWVRLRGRKLFHGLKGKTLGMLCLIGAILGFNWICLFEAYRYTTVATATLCYYFQPTIVLLLSPLLFREKLTAKKLLCAALAILGMVFVSGVTEGGGIPASQLRGVTFGLAGAALYALVVILNKKLPPIDMYEKTVIQLGAAAVTLLPYLLATEKLSSVRLDGPGLALLLVIGVVHTGVVYALYFGSMDGLRAQTIAILSYLDPVVALLVSALVLHEPLTVFGAVGAVLILGAAVFSEWDTGKNPIQDET